MTLQQGIQVRVYVIVLLLAIGFPGMGLVVYAQEREDQADDNSSSVFALPDWAEPAPQTPRESVASQSGVMQTRAPDLPPIDNVPIGGVGWLILTGAGYAILKLRGTR